MRQKTKQFKKEKFEEEYKKGPLLIKIENCPLTSRTEPCSESCKLQCKDQLAKKSNIIPIEQKFSSIIQIHGSDPIFYDEIPSKKNSSIRSTDLKVKSEIELKKPRIVQKKSSKITKYPSILEEKDMPSHDLPKCPSICHRNNILPRYHGPECALEVCIMEKHQTGCPVCSVHDPNQEYIDKYKVLDRFIYKTCHQHPYSNKKDYPQELNYKPLYCKICEKYPQMYPELLNKAKYQKQVSADKIPTNLSESSTYVDSDDTRRSGIDSIPNFREMKFVSPRPEDKEVKLSLPTPKQPQVINKYPAKITNSSISIYSTSHNTRDDAIESLPNFRTRRAFKKVKEDSKYKSMEGEVPSRKSTQDIYKEMLILLNELMRRKNLRHDDDVDLVPIKEGTADIPSKTTYAETKSNADLSKETNKKLNEISSELSVLISNKIDGKKSSDLSFVTPFAAGKLKQLSVHTSSRTTINEKSVDLGDSIKEKTSTLQTIIKSLSTFIPSLFEKKSSEKKITSDKGLLTEVKLKSPTSSDDSIKGSQTMLNDLRDKTLSSKSNSKQDLDEISEAYSNKNQTVSSALVDKTLSSKSKSKSKQDSDKNSEANLSTNNSSDGPQTVLSASVDKTLSSKSKSKSKQDSDKNSEANLSTNNSSDGPQTVLSGSGDKTLSSKSKSKSKQDSDKSSEVTLFSSKLKLQPVQTVSKTTINDNVKEEKSVDLKDSAKKKSSILKSIKKSVSSGIRSLKFKKNSSFSQETTEKIASDEGSSEERMLKSPTKSVDSSNGPQEVSMVLVDETSSSGSESKSKQDSDKNLEAISNINDASDGPQTVSNDLVDETFSSRSKSKSKIDWDKNLEANLNQNNYSDGPQSFANDLVNKTLSSTSTSKSKRDSSKSLEAESSALVDETISYISKSKSKLDLDENLEANLNKDDTFDELQTVSNDAVDETFSSKSKPKSKQASEENLNKNESSDDAQVVLSAIVDEIVSSKSKSISKLDLNKNLKVNLDKEALAKIVSEIIKQMSSSQLLKIISRKDKSNDS